MTERANRLAVYYLNLHRRYDLDVSNDLPLRVFNLQTACYRVELLVV